MAEVAKSKLACEKASDPGVKAFAEKMVKDHSECNEKIAEIAKKKKGITLPTTMNPSTRSPSPASGSCRAATSTRLT